MRAFATFLYLASLLALVSKANAGFDPGSQNNVAVYWGA